MVGFIYQQQAMPIDFKGVEVSMNVVDANGNYRPIGTATTDAADITVSLGHLILKANTQILQPSLALTDTTDHIQKQASLSTLHQ